MSVDAYVIDTRKSQAARLVPVPVDAVKLSPKSFWGKYQRANLERSLPRLFELFEEKGVLDNFRRLSGQKSCERRGARYTDSDIYKWMEGAAWALAGRDDATVRAQLETAITAILPAQSEDGYLNTQYTDPASRFTYCYGHEMYCAGHYFQAAIAIHRCLNDDRVLKSAVRYADYLYDTFGPGKDRKWACDHPEIELALVELYRTTGDKKYLEFARHILDQLNANGGWVKPINPGEPEVKFIRRKELFGHAVRNLYMASGASDIWAETGDRNFGRTVERLWENLVQRKMYITGGLGSRQAGEIIGLNFELPNLLACAETCAAIAFVFWNHRNLQVTGEPRYADYLERSLYNGVISGISLDYTKYFYENPLASLGDRRRVEWYDCTCCPSNMVRLLGSITGYFYSTSPEGIWVHLYDAGTAQIVLPDGRRVRIVQETEYPNDGRVKMTVEPADEARFAVHLRIPNWAEKVTVKINGKSVKTRFQPNRYLSLDRVWKKGDTIELILPMTVRAVACDPRVLDNYQRAVLMRGPLVYCLESTDNPGLPSVFQGAIRSGFSAQMTTVRGFKPSIPAIRLKGLCLKTSDVLYHPLGKHGKPKPAALTAIPYYAWANRGDSQMAVWIPVSK